MVSKRALSIVLIVSAILLAAGISLWFTGTARARLLPQPPKGVTIPYPGHLTDESGQTVPDGAYDFSFALYTVETGGTPLWTEMQEDVPVQGGAFATLLGSATPLPQETLDSYARWLEVAVRGSGEAEFIRLSPRQALSAILPVSQAGLSAGSACPHDHLGEEWEGTFTYGLKINNLGNGTALAGYSQSGTGLYGKSSSNGTGVNGVNDQNGYGVFGSSVSGWGVYGLSTNGTGIYGQTNATNMSGVRGYNADLAGGVGVSGIGGSVGVSGDSSNGIGVKGASSSGIAILASGGGIIKTTADSVLYLSPHDMVAREADPSVVNLSLQDNGGVRVRNMTGTSVTRYLVIPASTYGTLFGSPLYVKSVEVCYKSGNSLAFIDATGVYKNSGNDGMWSTYIENTDKRSSTAYACYTANAATPRKVINNSTWVQFNMIFGGNGSPWEIYIYTVELTLTESQN
jgi:hypothetical protein